MEANRICGWNYGVESEGSDVSLTRTTTNFNNVGVLLNNATANILTETTSIGNLTGFQISGGSGNSIVKSAAGRNSQYGFWVDGSQGNTVQGDAAEENALAGIYLGCSAKGIVNPSIPCTITTTTGNTILSNELSLNRDGIALERKSIYNKIEGNSSSGSLKYDMDDDNGNCIYNTYLGDAFGSKNLPCIQ